MRVLSCGSVGALVSTMDAGPPRATLDHVQAHDAALQAVVDRGVTAAAVRFGQSFASDDEACRHVAERGERVARLLDEYDGAVEVRLLLANAQGAEEPAPLAPQKDLGPGQAYLEQLRSHDHRLRQLGLRGALGPVVRAERVEELPKSRGVVFAHLVPRDQLAAYREAVAALPALADAKMVGPLALYSFGEPEQ